MIGPATDAPSDAMFWSGTTTATATCGLLAGAKPIIQSWLTLTPGPVWAVPVLTAAHRYEGKPTPAAVPPGWVDALHQRGHRLAPPRPTRPADIGFGV